MNKELTKDSIWGAVNNHVEVNWGQHWSNDQNVVQVGLKSERNSNSTNVVVLSENAAFNLYHALGIALGDLVKI